MYKTSSALCLRPTEDILESIAHGGHLKKEALTETTLKRISALNDIAQLRGQSLAEMALAWILKDDFVTSVIVGASSTGQLEKNLKASAG